MDHETRQSPRRERGRPRKDPADLRRTVVRVSFTSEEHAALERHRGELSAPDYLRSIALRGRRPTPPVPEVNRSEFIRLYQVEREVERCRIVLEQHAPAGAEHVPQLVQWLARMELEVVALRRALIGVDP